MSPRQQKPLPQIPAAHPTLLRPPADLGTVLAERIKLGVQMRDNPPQTGPDLRASQRSYQNWDEYNAELIRSSFDLDEPANQYTEDLGVYFVGPTSLQDEAHELHQDLERKIRRLGSLLDRLELFPISEQVTSNEATRSPLIVDPSNGEVFIVHGHDSGTKETVARLIGQLIGRQPVILHEQPNAGHTIVEKLEKHAAKASAAVVLLTPDDEGGILGQSDRLVRARQNVIFECGFFAGLIGRARVVILHTVGLELPSDLSGILYIELDAHGGWRTSLARELHSMGFSIGSSVLIG